ncbi:hypothetical protein CIB84_014763 [Bambusicola thoracicus]|uniref:Uncharacterized protein n=1 Tax=Bambusicola thoracicus TaxID=9083 RepID=A0A2P4SBJ8_BAMTH|nr:hypothetical protein CIB84_014763 [Bambusicola thoracicus]
MKMHTSGKTIGMMTT